MQSLLITGCSLSQIRQFVNSPFTVLFSFMRVASDEDSTEPYCFVCNVPDNNLTLRSFCFSLGSVIAVDCINIMAERADFLFDEKPF